MTIGQANDAIRNIGKKQAIAKPAIKAISKTTTAKKVALVKPRRKLPANAVTIRCKFNPTLTQWHSYPGQRWSAPRFGAIDR
jgi:hypothetical protein